MLKSKAKKTIKKLSKIMNNQKQASRLSRISQILKTKKNILILINQKPTVDQLLSGVCLASMIRQIPLSKSSGALDAKDYKKGKNEPNKALNTLSSGSQSRNISVVFKGKINAALDFLKTEEFISKTTDSFRDMIISIDSKKVDKLYSRQAKNKKEVNIVISPYRNSEGLSEEDVTYSKGEINIDAVVTLGVNSLSELDGEQTPKSLLTNNPVVSLSCDNKPSLSDNFDDLDDRQIVSWNVKKSSCLAEMIWSLNSKLNCKISREQALIFMTSIITATDRFRTENTSTETFKIAAEMRKIISNKDHQNILNQIEKYELSSSTIMEWSESAEKVDHSSPQTTIRQAKVESRKQTKRQVQTIEKLVGGSEPSASRVSETDGVSSPVYRQPEISPKAGSPSQLMAASSQEEAKPSLSKDAQNLEGSNPAQAKTNYQEAPNSPVSLSLDSNQNQSSPDLTNQVLPTNNITATPAQSNLYQPNQSSAAANRLQKPVQALKQTPQQTAAVLARIQQTGSNSPSATPTTN